MKICTRSVLLRSLLITLCAVAAPLTKAANELLVYAFANGQPVVGAEVFLGDS